MYARVTELSGSPDDIDAGIADFRKDVVPFTHARGGKGAILLVDRATGRALVRCRDECGQPARRGARRHHTRARNTRAMV